jgi:iron-sulfur cluster repair protein YtfE (RIC family)
MGKVFADQGPVADIGLRYRMRSERRRISSQHRKLDELFAAVDEALFRSGIHTARVAFTRFGDALEAHLSLEESIYFPALHGLRPDAAGELDHLLAEHTELRRRMRELSALFEAGETETTAARLASLADRVADHEEAEELLIARIAASDRAV